MNLDPTYLRYIYDNLIKGSIHPENESELPDGLIGLYEEAFEEHLPVMERQKTLKRFALFALLKKEVSVSYVTEVLEESEDEILVFISNFSSWFNSPESGKYQLYHERLKVYLLQKLTEKEIQVIHQHLISRLEKAIEELKEDEFERYALEFLSEHMLVEAFENEADGKRLLDFTKKEANWDRQIRISNKFEWSRKGLHYAALWTSKYDQEENIDCYLDLVQLHNKEQNDAESIVRLVANNEIDLALERITAFGGPSKEEKERQFIIFMLCLMELTLLESKTQPWRKEAIERLLKHLDDEISVDHSLVNWEEFFSFQLMLNILEQLKKLSIDFSVLIFRSEINTIEIEMSYYESQLSVLLLLTNYLDDEYQTKSEAISKIAIKYSEIGLFEKALKIAEEIENKYWNFYTLLSVSEILFNSNKKKEGKLLLKKAIIINAKIEHKYWKSQALILLSAKLFLLKYKNQAKVKLDEALLLVTNLDIDNWYFELIIQICKEYMKQGFHNIALNQVKHIKDDYKKCKILIELYDESNQIGLKEELFNLLNKKNDFNQNDSDNLFQKLALILIKKQQINQALEIIKKLNDYNYKGSLILMEIAKNYIEKNNLNLAIDTIDNISHGYFKSLTLINFIETIFKKSLNSFDQNQYIEKAINEIVGINEEHLRVESYIALAEVLIEYNQQDFLLFFNVEINDEYDKKQFYCDLITIYTKRSLNNFSFKILIEFLKLKGGIYKEYEYFKEEILKEISTNYINKGYLNHSLIIANSISVEFYKNEILTNLIYENTKIGLNESLNDILNNIEDSEDRLSAILFACDLCIKNNFNNISFLLDKAIEITQEITEELERIKLMIQISSRFKENKQNYKSSSILNEAYDIAKKILNEDFKNKALELIAIEFLAINYNDYYNEIIKSITSIGILNTIKKENVKLKINNCEYDDAVSISRSISDDYLRLNSLVLISKNLFNNDSITANNLIQEVIKEMSSLKNNFLTNSIFMQVISCLIEIEKLEESLNIIFLIDDTREKNEAIEKVALAYHNIGNSQYALELLSKIQDSNSKDSCRRMMVNSMLKKSNFANAIEIAFEIEDEGEKGRAISNISIELLKYGFIEESIDLSFKIPFIQKKHDTWIEIAKIKSQYFIETNFEIILNNYLFSKSFIQLVFSKTINLKNLSILTNSKFLKVLLNTKDFYQGLDEIFYLYSIHNIFFNPNYPQDKLKKFNRVLNLQWAIDLKKELDELPN